MTDRAAIVYDCLFPINRGGGERVYRRMAELLVDRGLRVDYLTREQWRPGKTPDATFEILPVWKGDIYDEQGTRTTNSAVRFAIGVYRHFRTHRHDYDLVIASALPLLTLLATRLALFGGKTRVVADWLEVWDRAKWWSYAGPLTGTVAWALQAIGLRSAHGHTVNSRFTARRMLRLNRRADPLVLGLLDLIDAEREVHPAADPPYALFVGRHIPDKRVTAIPAALRVARAQIPELRAVIAGDGPETPLLIDEVRQTGLIDAIDVVGKVGDVELDRLYAGATVLINPSAREGFGLVVAEAAMRGVPSVVVAGDDNAAAELIEEGVNGFVTASTDPQLLGDAIVSVASAGDEIRRATRAWFDRERGSARLRASIDELLRRYRNSD